MFVKIKRLPNLGSLPLPQYGKEGDAARDLCAAIDVDIVILPGDTAKIPTGIALDLGPGIEGQVRPRSSLGLKGVLVYWGTVDPTYSGEVCAVLHNLSKTPFIVSRGDRVAQLVIASVAHYEWQEVDELRTTSRGSQGFGSTGK